MEQPEMTVVQKLEADHAQAQADLEAVRKDLAAAQATATAQAAEIETLKADASAKGAALEAAQKDLETVRASEAQAKSDAAAALELAQKAEDRSKQLEGAIKRDPEVLKFLGIAGTTPLAGTMSAGDGPEPASFEEAVKACGGGDAGYLAARRKFQKLWEASLKKQ